MKVCSPPASIKVPEPDYSGNFNWQDFDKLEEQFKVDCKNWLLANGYAGPNTGKTISFGVADGAAEYMYADGGRSSFLMHLPLGDAYQYRDVQFLPKAEILRRLVSEEKMAKLFGRK